MFKKDIDDKDLVITAVLAICVIAMFVLPSGEASGIVSNAIAGLFGVAVGKSLNGNGGNVAP